MRISSEFLLTFLLNACWQIALIAALTSLGSYLLRSSSARYRHGLWVGALCLSLLVPLITASRFQLGRLSVANTPVHADALVERAQPFALNNGARSVTPTTAPLSFQLNRSVVMTLFVAYFAFLLFRSIKLALAWRNTRNIRRNAREIGPNEKVARAIEKCESAIQLSPGLVTVLSSETIPVPVTIGAASPVIILPEALLLEDSSELITSAIGHEFVHIARRDYVLNFLYEVLSVPVSFNPAAALIRRRIKQTRELFCDEVVAERILSPEIYARSLVKLASSAPPLRRLSLTTTVGIADADILEARIMSLLKKPTTNPRSRKLLLIASALLLIVPCIAAAAFAMRFDVNPDAQDPTQQEKERRETELDKIKRESANKEEMMYKIASDPKLRAELDERKRKQAIEIEIKAKTQAELVKLARIPMDQAIQIATSQSPGKVLQCNLFGERWEEPGKLAKDGQVLYHVVILPVSLPDDSSVTLHVFVNAIDGSIVRSEKELPRKMRSPQP